MSGAVLLLSVVARPASAEDNIRAFVNSSGRVVFTNLVDNAPPLPTPIIAETTDVLAEEIPVALRTLVDTISKNYGVDPGLVRAVIKTESNFNRWAVSNKGARGLMQLIPETGRRFGVQDFFDPRQNVDGGVRYLRFLLDKFNGNLDLSLAAYNAGENLVEKLGRIPPIAETTNYVRRIRAIYKKPSAPLGPLGPLTMPAAPPATMIAAAEPAGEQPPPPPAPVYKTVDEHGMMHFSNIEPPH